MYSEHITWIFFCAVSLLWGAAAGSFSTMLSYRLPRNIPLWGRSGKKKADFSYSACPSCGHRLNAGDLIPLVSWILSCGKCRYCKKGISVRYPVIEIFSVMLAFMFFWAEGPGPALIPLLLTVPVFVSLIVIDWDFRILPDSLNIAAFVFGLVFLTADNSELLPAIVSSAVYAVTAFVIRFAVSAVLKKEAMGWGDIKFFAVAGLWLGLGLLPQFMIFSGFSGIVFGVVYRKINKISLFPFGPALIISMIICFVFGELIFL